ncbi:MAG TPA: sigma 54-interacting transcriptional regulator [Myxococcota bacterium]|nr:sigma 54-interacting transcriptional regulator [Myxococcota bacterium]
MQRFHPLLLALWRECCQHLSIEESLARTSPLLARRLPVDLVAIRRLEAARACVETAAAVAVHEQPTPEPARSELLPHQFEELVAWSRAGRVLHRRARTLAEQLPGLLPDEIEGDVIAGPLSDEAGPAGVLLLVAQRSRHFNAEHVALAQALLDPFSAALENDRRLHRLATQQAAAEADRSSLLSRLGRHDLQETIVGAEEGFRPVMERVAQVAPSDVPVLILGETGSGKEVVARAIHVRSRRAAGPFLRVNCGAIPSGLVDSELFGHERGSFTGAASQRRGWFERADGGTLFLDEVGELPLQAQVRLLRVLQDGSLERVGGQRSLHVDVRIVAATHRDLRAMVADRQFREDLWYRIAVFPIEVPPLRERPEDIPALATHFALRAATRFGTPPRIPSPEDANRLLAYAWPGNVRELASVIERAVILGNGRSLEVATALGLGASSPSRPAVRPELHASPWPPEQDDRLEYPASGAEGAARSEPKASEVNRRATAQQAPEGGAQRGEAERSPSGRAAAQQSNGASAEIVSLDDAIRRHIEAALERTRGRIEGSRGAAALLRVNPYTLRSKMRKLAIDWSRFRGD